jgi:hypothetical protein
MMLLGATHLLAQDQVRLLLNPQRIEQGTATTIGQCLEHVIHRVGDSFEDLR